MKKHFKSESSIFNTGFSLVEMAVVLVIVGLLISGLLVPLGAQRDLKDYTETKLRLEQIRDALYGYAIINGKLPCPTTTTNPADAANYGHSDATCAVAADAGVLPWRDLGVREVDSWGTVRMQNADPWNGYWVYRVDPAFASIFTLLTTTSADIDVQRSDGTSLTIGAERAVAVICSTGKNRTPNGHNAFYEKIVGTIKYEDDTQTATFDDMCIWITRPSLFNRMVTAGKLP